MGQPSESPWRLAMVTILQFIEGLSDQRATDAIRGRIVWKYLLWLPLDDPGFDDSVLSQFRNRLIAGGPERLLLDELLPYFRRGGLISPYRQLRSDVDDVLAFVRDRNR